MLLLDKEVEIARTLWHVNMLVNFPISDMQIDFWAKTIHELRPNQNVDILKKILNMMKMGTIEYNSKEGIQNIFKALNEYDPIKVGYIDHDTPDSYYGRGEKERKFYFEGDKFPDDMIWLLDKLEYYKHRLEVKNERRMAY